MSRFHELLLSEMRILESNQKENKDSKGDIASALIDNENLKALGYQLADKDIVRLAKEYQSNPNMQPLYKRVMDLEPAITVSPMYPNFPKQVMEMDEIKYRTHQIMHYFSTYGLEDVLGIEIEEGWLPETVNIESRIKDKQVADLKTIDYLSTVEIEQKIINDLIGRNERLQPKEIELAKTVLLKTDLIIDNVPFKDNIGAIYGDILLNGELEDRYKVFSALTDIIKHPGDVLDLTEYMVVKNKYKHFKTSVKRGLVSLFEQFSYGAIEENLASNRWSNRFLGKGGKPRSINRNIALIDYLSFNRFATSKDAMEIVNELKDGNLISWNQKLEQAYTEGDFKLVLNLLSQRPGIMFRQVNRLVKLGVDHKEIMKSLKASAGDLKTQTIISALNNYDGVEEVDKVFFSTLIANLLSKDMDDFRGKTIFIDEKDVDFSKSKIEITDKFEGYITNGLAIKIPENTKFLRFFTYWNDEKRIDVDLHGATVYKDGRRSHVGWNGRFRDDSLVHSGDITHSNATEYIDMDLEAAREEGIEFVQFNINSYTEIPFNNIDTVFTGLMALSKMRAEVDLFDPKNVLFRHDLEYKAMSIDYSVIDVVNNLMFINGTPSHTHNDENVKVAPVIKLSILVYLSLLILTQGGNIVDNKDDADLVLGLAKSDEDNYVSLIDKNFYM